MSTNRNIKPDELSTDSPSLEPFVDAQTAAKFWAIERRQLLAMARIGAIPAYPASLSPRRKRCTCITRASATTSKQSSYKHQMKNTNS